ncbi:MAG: T9SS type A sorting domain-containing protein, partial [Flavobacteriales bacterium]|nr:T9SS type A sorting domain-containing protein [Flavobacteriales bacterium]
NTRHSVASVSKTICTITLANVLEAEGIDWDEPIAPYLPVEWQGQLAPEHSDPFSPCYLTFEKLVTHQSCIGFSTNGSGPYPDADAMFLFIGSDSLDMNPSSGLGDYQNGNFVLARMLISEIVGEFILPAPTDASYDFDSANLYYALADAYIFSPLGIDAPLTTNELEAYLTGNPPRGHQYPFSNPSGCGSSLGWTGYQDPITNAGSSGIQLSSLDLAEVLAFFKHDNSGTIISTSQRDYILDNFLGMSQSEVNSATSLEFGTYYAKSGTRGPEPTCNRGLRARIAIYPNDIELVVTTNSQMGVLGQISNEWENSWAYDCQTFVHTAADATISGNYSVIDNPYTNGDSEKLLFISHDFANNGQTLNSPQGVWYNGTNWAIFNQDQSDPMPKGNRYNVYAVKADYERAFKHVAAINNLSGHITTINHPLTNNNPDANLIVTQNWEEFPGVYNDHPIGVYYANGTWRIFNEDFGSMLEGATFNVLVDHPNSFDHIATAPFGGITVIDNSELPDQDKDQMLFVTNNWGTSGPYNNSELGVWFVSNSWLIYNENGTSISTNAKFNAVVMEDCECCEDNEKPKFVNCSGTFCPFYTDTLECMANYVPEIPEAIDNCSRTLVELNDVDTFYTGTTRIRYEYLATDVQGNSAEMNYYVYFTDSIKPQISGIPNDTVTSCGIPPIPEVVIVTDNCDSSIIPTFEETSEGSDCSFKITRTWTAVDLAGNSCVASYCIYSGTYADQDQDGFNILEDCDDLRDDIYPGATEYCDGEDNDCDSEIDESCLDCTAFIHAPTDLTKSFQPIPFPNGVQDRVQLKFYKEPGQVKYQIEDSAACDIEAWPVKDLENNTPIIDGDTIRLVDVSKPNKELFKWPLKYRADGANNNKRVDPNTRYKWRVRCACNYGLDVESPWSLIKFFNTPDFDPSTGIFSIPPGILKDDLGDIKINNVDKAWNIRIYPNPTSADIYVDLKEIGDKAIAYSVLDITGKQVINEPINTGRDGMIRVDLGSVQNGLYLILIETDEGCITRKFEKR